MKRNKRTNYNDIDNMDHAEKKFYGDQMKEMGCKGFVLRDIWDVLGPYLLIIVAVISLLVGILIGWNWRASRDGGTLAMENPPEQVTEVPQTTEYRAEVPGEETTPPQQEPEQTTPPQQEPEDTPSVVTTVPPQEEPEGLPQEPEKPDDPTPVRTSPRPNTVQTAVPVSPVVTTSPPVVTRPRQTTARPVTTRRTTPPVTTAPTVRTTTAAPVVTTTRVVTTAPPPAPILKGMYVTISKSGSPTREGNLYSTTFCIRISNTTTDTLNKQKLLFSVPTGTTVKVEPDNSTAYVSGKYLSITSNNEIRAGKTISIYVTLEYSEILNTSSIVLCSAQ